MGASSVHYAPPAASCKDGTSAICSPTAVDAGSLDALSRISDNLVTMPSTRRVFCCAAAVLTLAAPGCRAGAPADPPSPSAFPTPSPAPASADAPPTQVDAASPAVSVVPTSAAGSVAPAASPAIEQCSAIDGDVCVEPDPGDCACMGSCHKACLQCARRCKQACVKCASSCDPESWACGSACASNLLGCPASCIEPQSTCLIACATGSKCP